ncbi:hypothetical protein [Rhizosphaericola mali]|uniref:Uncharacterized protein n=1 Tax=Rhizosphaericola mali TaxID=2545455 RepID=A0A5P2G9H0_9BACT|nr:hypothetical protein [Rhizosphaericola mali]QES88171.1 hypothetical protein E0W69_005650 [Rhizosphaericola mali]
MKMITLGLISMICVTKLNAQNFKFPFKHDTIPSLKFGGKNFIIKSISPKLVFVESKFVQKLPNNLNNTGKKTANGFDIYVADIDKMSVLMPNNQNPNYIGGKSSNDLEFK